MTRPPIIHHTWGFPCDARECVRARRADKGFNRFLAVVLGGLFLAGVYLVISAGLFAWLRF